MLETIGAKVCKAWAVQWNYSSSSKAPACGMIGGIEKETFSIPPNSADISKIEKKIFSVTSDSTCKRPACGMITGIEKKTFSIPPNPADISKIEKKFFFITSDSTCATFVRNIGSGIKL